MITRHPLSRQAILVLFFILSTWMLFLGFYRNQWNVVREKKFKEFQLDSESLVIARMVESRVHGLFAENGLLGWGDANPQDLNVSDYEHQYDVFLAGGEFQSYSLYKSASGAQAFFFGILQELSPFTPAVDLRNFRALEALLFALAISLFVTWTHREFGFITACVVLLSTILSQWITLYGRNLFYFMWVSFLPLGVMLLYLSRWDPPRMPSYRGLAAVAFGSLLLKCLMNGYDFIIPALSMPVVPLVYFAVRDRWNLSESGKRLAVVGGSVLGAVMLSILILAAQLQITEGTLAGGLTSILSTFSRRTYSDPSLFPGYAASLEANPWSVLWTYVSEDTAMAPLGLRFLDVILIFAGTTVLHFAWKTWRPNRLNDQYKTVALICATWVSLLSPVSWFVIFKGQAFVHTHTNYLAWHMPFTLIGFAMCALIVSSIGKDLLYRARPAPPG